MTHARLHRMAAVGTFDGVHAGHRLLLDTLRSRAEAGGYEPCVVTFAEHPLATVRPERVPPLICSVAERVELIRREGIAEVVVMHFDEALRRLTAAEFMQLLRSRHGVGAMLVGFNNSFGSDRLCGMEAYREAAARSGVAVEAAPELPGLSSSAIRRLILDGDTAGAAEMLGRPFALEGKVVEGRHIGRTIGWPTANIELDGTLIRPAAGVYAARAAVDGASAGIPAVVNIGVRPTVDRSSHPEVTVEAHLIGIDADLYGRTIRLDFGHRLRPERRFSSVEALRKAIEEDARNVIALS